MDTAKLPEYVEPEKAAETVAKLEIGAASLAIQEANALIVNSGETYNNAAEFHKAIKGRIQNLETLRKKIVKPFQDAVKNVQEMFKGPGNSWADAGKIVERKMLTFRAEQERKRREEEARLTEIRAKEQAKLNAQFEKKAAKAEDKGDLQAAAEIRAMTPQVSTPSEALLPETPKVEGQYVRKGWDIEIFDANLVPREYCIPDEKKIKKMIGASDGTLSIPGVKNIPKDTLVTRI